MKNTMLVLLGLAFSVSLVFGFGQWRQRVAIEDRHRRATEVAQALRVCESIPGPSREAKAPGLQGVTTSHSRRLWRGGATPQAGMHRPPGDGRGLIHRL